MAITGLCASDELVLLHLYGYNFVPKASDVNIIVSGILDVCQWLVGSGRFLKCCPVGI